MRNCQPSMRLMQNPVPLPQSCQHWTHAQAKFANAPPAHELSQTPIPLTTQESSSHDADDANSAKE